MSASEGVVQESIASILSAKEPPAEPTGETAAPPADTKGTATPEPKDDKAEVKAPVRDETGKFAKSEKDDAKAETSLTPAHIAAIRDERAKRQAAEAELSRLRAESAKTPKPSFLEDEEGAFNSRMTEAISPVQARFFNLSEKMARTQYGASYDEARQAVGAALEGGDPQLLAELRASDDPGEFIFKRGKQLVLQAKYGGDIEKYVGEKTATLTGEIATRDTQIKTLEAQVAALQAANQNIASLPKSLNERGSGAAPKAGSEDPEDIKSIVKFGNTKT